MSLNVQNVILLAPFTEKLWPPFSGVVNRHLKGVQFKLTNTLCTLHTHDHAFQEPYGYVSCKAIRFQTECLVPSSRKHHKPKGEADAPHCHSMVGASPQNAFASLKTVTCDIHREYASAAQTTNCPIRRRRSGGSFLRRD